MIELIKELSFRNPYYLLLWALIPLIYFILKKYYTKKIDTINLPESSSLLKFKKNWKWSNGYCQIVLTPSISDLEKIY